MPEVIEVRLEDGTLVNTAPGKLDAVLVRRAFTELSAEITMLRQQLAADGPDRARYKGVRDKWKIIDGDCREGAEGLITYHVDAFDEGYENGLRDGKAATGDAPAASISEEGVLFSACMVRHIDPNGTPQEVLDRLINWEVQINAEFATTTATDADVADARRYRWLQKQRSHVWHEFAETPMNSTDDFIDKAIAASAPKEDGND